MSEINLEINDSAGAGSLVAATPEEIPMTLTFRTVPYGKVEPGHLHPFGRTPEIRIKFERSGNELLTTVSLAGFPDPSPEIAGETLLDLANDLLNEEFQAEYAAQVARTKLLARD